MQCAPATPSICIQENPCEEEDNPFIAPCCQQWWLIVIQHPPSAWQQSKRSHLTPSRNSKSLIDGACAWKRRWYLDFSITSWPEQIKLLNGTVASLKTSPRRCFPCSARRDPSSSRWGQSCSKRPFNWESTRVASRKTIFCHFIIKALAPLNSWDVRNKNKPAIRRRPWARKQGGLPRQSRTAPAETPTSAAKAASSSESQQRDSSNTSKHSTASTVCLCAWKGKGRRHLSDKCRRLLS